MKTILLAVLITLSFSGCWLIPYQENFSCNNDIYNGRCGMVRDNYNYEENSKSDFKYVFDENKTTQIKGKNTDTKTNCSDTNGFKDLVKCHEENSKKYDYILIKKQRGE